MTAHSKRLAAIDMGSNSFHLLLADVSLRGFYPPPRVISSFKHKVRLADGFDANFHLNNASIERAQQCLQGFAQQLTEFQPDVVKAVATAALRKSTNQQQVLPILEQALGYPIEVITGEREAGLIFAGVSSTARHSGSLLVIDIGGASTEVIAGKALHPEALYSFDMGCVVFQNSYFPNGLITAGNFDSAIHQARAQVRGQAHQFHRVGWEHVLGASGAFRATCEIAMAESTASRQPARLNRTWLRQLIDRCIRCGSVDAIDFVGLREDRRAVLCGGLAILYGVLTELGIESYAVTDGALREGLLAEMAAIATA